MSDYTFINADYSLEQDIMPWSFAISTQYPQIHSAIDVFPDALSAAHFSNQAVKASRTDLWPFESSSTINQTFQSINEMKATKLSSSNLWQRRHGSRHHSESQSMHSSMESPWTFSSASASGSASVSDLISSPVILTDSFWPARQSDVEQGTLKSSSSSQLFRPASTSWMAQDQNHICYNESFQHPFNDEQAIMRSFLPIPSLDLSVETLPSIATDTISPSTRSEQYEMDTISDVSSRSRQCRDTHKSKTRSSQKSFLKSERQQERAVKKNKAKKGGYATKTHTDVNDDGVMKINEEIRHVCLYPSCGKDFSTSGHARRHGRIHSNLRPFECPHPNCGSTFTRRDNCTQHQRSRHPISLPAYRLSPE